MYYYVESRKLDRFILGQRPSFMDERRFIFYQKKFVHAIICQLWPIVLDANISNLL